MPIYFASSDESGNYRRDASEKFVKSNPFYSRCTVLTKANNWKVLRQSLHDIRMQYELPDQVEVKWSHIWSISKHERKNEKIPPNRPYSRLGLYLNSSQILEFVHGVLGFLQSIDYCKIIITVSKNKPHDTVPEAWHLERHLEAHMQRIEMGLQEEDDNLAVVFADPLSEDKDKGLRDAYHNIFQSGAFIKEYSHIKDSLNFEYSHHSAGIQIADFIAGSFNGMLRGFPESNTIFHERVKPFLRRSKDGIIMGFGIKEIPKNDEFRRFVADLVLS